MGITANYPAVTVTPEERVYEGMRERADLVLHATGEVTQIIERKTLSNTSS
jgi:predicted type IV restriction endonuclease